LVITDHGTVFELHADANKVRCKECYEGSPSKTPWIAWGSRRQHLTTGEHLHHVEQNKKRVQLAEERRIQSQAPYTSGSIALDPLFYNRVPPPRPSFSQRIDSDNAASLGSGEPMADSDMYMDPIIPAYMEPISDDPMEEIERLRREVEFLRLEAEQRDEFGAEMFEDDATLTNAAHNFGALLLPRTCCTASRF
jgi:hypothetical protein